MITGPAPFGQALPTIRCPYCLDLFQWDGQTLYERDENGVYQQLPPVSPDTDILKREDQQRKAFVRCPNPSGDMADRPHHLPIDYMRYREPLVIGFIGDADSGKSTLLAMMVNDIDNNRLLPYGFAAVPLLQEEHETYRTAKVNPLLRGTPLEKTKATQEASVEFTDGFLLLKDDDHKQPVVFFDVGGEALGNIGAKKSQEDIGAKKSQGDNSRATRFLQAVSAFIFVVDPDRLTGQDGDDTVAVAPQDTDQTFRKVLSTIIGPSAARPMRLAIPAAIVLAKADLLRFEPTIARWLTREDGTGRVDPQAIRDESRDVYAFLYQNDGEPWLLPFDRFRKCTLHAVSATGSRLFNHKYRRLRPRHVLDPLVAILAMTGVIEDPAATEVGT